VNREAYTANSIYDKATDLNALGESQGGISKYFDIIHKMQQNKN